MLRNRLSRVTPLAGRGFTFATGLQCPNRARPSPLESGYTADERTTDRASVLWRQIAVPPAIPGDPLAAASGSTGPEAGPSPSPAQPPPAPAPASTPRLGLDRQGLLEATGGTVIALLALVSSDSTSRGFKTTRGARSRSRVRTLAPLHHPG